MFRYRTTTRNSQGGNLNGKLAFVRVGGDINVKK